MTRRLLRLPLNGPLLLDLVSHGRLGSPERLSLPQIEQIRRTVRREPEVMVKVTGGGRSIRAVAAHLAYIGHQGEVELESDRGDHITEGGQKELLDTWHLEFCAGQYRSKGTALLEFIEAWARKRGYREMASDAEIDNEASILLHGRRGFVEVGPTRAFPQDALNSDWSTGREARITAPPDSVVGHRFRVAASVLLCACALLLSGCIYFMKHTPPGACSNDLGSPVRNFCVVAPGIFWRGARPGRSDAQWLIDHRVGTIVSLELDVRRAFESARPDPHLTQSVTYFQVRAFSAVQVVTHAHLDDHVALVLAIIEEAPKPVFVNCRAGVDRTAMMAAAYRVLIEGVSPEQAVREMERFRTPWAMLNAHYIRSLTGARAAAIHRDMQEWESRLRPSGRFDCRDGQCRFERLRAELNVKPTRP